MTVSPYPVTHGASPQLRTGHTSNFSRDVPQGDVDSRDGRRANNAVTVPEVLPEHHLPQVLDAARVFADDQFRNIFNCTDNRARVPFERRLTPSVKPRLVGHYFDEHPIPHPRVANKSFNLGDFHAALKVMMVVRVRRQLPILGRFQPFDQ